jgi:type II secretory pathway component PulC
VNEIYEKPLRKRKNNETHVQDEIKQIQVSGSLENVVSGNDGIDEKIAVGQKSRRRFDDVKVQSPNELVVFRRQNVAGEDEKEILNFELSSRVRL